jgi:hypothetical protein
VSDPQSLAQDPAEDLKGPKPEGPLLREPEDMADVDRPAGTAEAAIRFLRDNLGIGEHPEGSNHNQLTERFFEGAGRPSELADGHFAWCAAAVSLALNSAWGDADRWRVPGVAATYRNGTAYVPALRLAFVKAELFDDVPRAGDVLFIGPDPEGRHAGLVERVLDDGRLAPLEGNWSDDLLALVRDPDDPVDPVIGFGHPPYAVDPFAALSPDEQDALVRAATSSNAAVGRLEAAVRDPAHGLQAQLDRIRAMLARRPSR